jgi:hypothetical protein
LANKTNADWVTVRVEGKMIRRTLTDAIQELISYAFNQGSKNADKLFGVYTLLVNKSAGIEAKGRDTADAKTLTNIKLIEELFANIIIDEMSGNMHYKEIYQICKARGQELINLLNYSSGLLKIS